VVVPNIITTIWEKFVHNCGINAISALTGVRPGEFREVPGIDEFQTRIIEETLSVLRMKGIVLPNAILYKRSRLTAHISFIAINVATLKARTAN
jgi:ketopantoate reductase